MMRTGAEYLRSLKDGRGVFVDGERVKDVTAASGVSPGGALDRQPDGHRGGARDARAHDVHLAENRRAGVAGLADPAHARRPARTAVVLGDLGRGDLRPDGTHARSCRRLLLRLCGDAAGAGGGRPEIRRQCRRVLRVHARQPHLRELRDRAAADRPLEARAQAERPDALRRRGQGARRRHRHFRRTAARDRRRAVGLHPSELHPPLATGRRELRQLRRHPGRAPKA